MDKKASSKDFASVLSQNGIKKLYHFTDRDNLESIIINGGLYSWADCEEKGIRIPKPGGGQLSRDLDRRDDLQHYVRVSFTKEHPMMYVAMNEGRISNPVILEIDPEVVEWEGTLFSDRNATRNGAMIGGTLSDLKKIHFGSVKARNHFDLDEEEQPFFQAEVLVKNFIPLRYITITADFPKDSPTLPTLSASHPVGTKGKYKGREAVRVDLNGRKYVIATRNEGAKKVTDFGNHYTFDGAVKLFSVGRESYSVSEVWRLPTRGELYSFAKLENSWGTLNGVKGRSFKVSEGCFIFLPAAGCDSAGSIYRQGKDGYYWPSTSCNSDGACVLGFNSNDCDISGGSGGSYYDRSYGRSVRLFCALPTDDNKKLPTLTASHLVGTKGIYKGREAIRIDLNGKPYVIATRNEGAEEETEFGNHYTFDDAVELFAAGRENYSAVRVWRLPTHDELDYFAKLENSETTLNGVGGVTFKVSAGCTIFLPAAGHVSSNNGALCGQGSEGRYWSSASYSQDCVNGLRFLMGFSYMDDDSNRLDGRSVRLLCALSSKKGKASPVRNRSSSANGQSSTKQQTTSLPMHAPPSENDKATTGSNRSSSAIGPSSPEQQTASLPTLTANHPAGTNGIYKGREAIRVDLGGKKFVIATRNEGAKSDTDYGDHFTFDEALKKFSAGKEDYDAEDVWRLPTKKELESFACLENLWTRSSGVDGRSFIVASDNSLFLPAAGSIWGDVGSLYDQGRNGRYSSSTPDDSHNAYGLDFDNGLCGVYCYGRNYGGSVRLFCALPSE